MHPRSARRAGLLLAFMMVVQFVVMTVVMTLASASAVAQPTTTLVAASWGDGPDQLGRRGGDESAAEGPMSFAVAADGSIFVLDQVHARVLRFTPTGERQGSIVLAWDTFQDIAWMAPNRLLVMDRLVQQVIHVIDVESGAVLEEWALADAGIAEGGLTTALIAAGDGVWVELEHTSSVRIADASGEPTRGDRTVQGRPLFAPAHTVRAKLFKGQTAAMTLFPRGAAAESGEHQPTERAVAFSWPVENLAEIGRLEDGRLVVAALTSRDPDATSETIEMRMEVVALDPSGKQVARHTGPASIFPWEQMHTLRVGADGALYQMLFTDAGVRVVTWTL